MINKFRSFLTSISLLAIGLQTGHAMNSAGQADDSPLHVPTPQRDYQREVSMEENQEGSCRISREERRQRREERKRQHEEQIQQKAPDTHAAPPPDRPVKKKPPAEDFRKQLLSQQLKEKEAELLSNARQKAQKSSPRESRRERFSWFMETLQLLDITLMLRGRTQEFQEEVQRYQQQIRYYKEKTRRFNEESRQMQATLKWVNFFLQHFKTSDEIKKAKDKLSYLALAALDID